MKENELRERVKVAVKNVPAPPALDARIRGKLQARKPPSRTTSFSLTWAPAIAAAVVIACVTAGVAYQHGYLRLTAAAQEQYNQAVCHEVASVIRPALGDHIQCAVFRKYPKNPPSVAEFVHDLGPEYAGLLDAIKGRLPADYRIQLAHRCTYHGRWFVHLAFRSDAGISSLIISEKQAGESLPEDARQASAQRFRISAFATKSHLVYFISDTDRQENSAALTALAPAVRGVLAKIEG